MTDEFYATSLALRSFIDHTLRIVAAEAKVEPRIDQIRPAFAALLTDPSWLPAEFAVPCADSRMGSGIGSYLLYRREDRALTLHALVVPPKAETPIHDHLAWGLVGLYRGEQEEEVFRRLDDGTAPNRAVLKFLEMRRITPRQFYALLPPEGDIHRVRTISAVPSVSIHLLGNDLGCIWRHRFDPDHETAHDFRSGYVNVECND